MPEWISIEDRLPEKPGHYLCYVRGMFDVLWYGKGTEMLWKYEVTHWMPLPNPPVERRDAE